MKKCGIKEGSIFCALIFILMIVTSYLPFLSILLFLIPIMVVILYKQQGLKTSVIASVVTIILLALFISTMMALYVGALLLIVGGSLGYAYHKEFTPTKKVITGALSFLAFFMIQLISYELLADINMTTDFVEGVEKAAVEITQLYESNQLLNAEQLEVYKASIENFVETMKLAYPSLFFLQATVFGAVNVAIGDRFLRMKNYKIKQAKPFSQWALPDTLKVFLMILLLVDFVMSLSQSPPIPPIYTATIMNFVYVIFFVVGLSVLFDYMAHKHISNRGLKALCAIISLLLLSWIVTIIGVVESYFGLRRIYRREF